MKIEHLVILYQCDECRKIVNGETHYHSKLTGKDYCEKCFRVYEKQKDDEKYCQVCGCEPFPKKKEENK